MSTREIARGGLLAAGGHGVAVFRRCDAADRTGGLPDSRCGLSDTAAAPREHKNGWAAVPRHLGTGLLLTPRKLIAAAYVLLFGLYPIVKYLIECRLPVFTQLSGKLAYFNIVLVLAAVLVGCGLFPQVQMPGISRLAGLWIAANIGFIVYDIGLSKVIALLRRTLPPE